MDRGLPGSTRCHSTTSPSKLKGFGLYGIDTISVEIERPRDDTVLTSPEFIKLKKRIMTSLREEVGKALEMG